MTESHVAESRDEDFIGSLEEDDYFDDEDRTCASQMMQEASNVCVYVKDLIFGYFTSSGLTDSLHDIE